MTSTDSLKNPRLFVGPMSKEIVDLVIEYSNKNNSMGLIPSRRQIENSGGYVNNWTTQDFSSYVREKNEAIVLVRDHGGPGQGQGDDDGLESLCSDMNNNFDLLHIDPWKTSKSLDEGIKKTLSLIEYCCDKSDSVYFEVGTEEAIFSYSPRDLERIIQELKKGLGSRFSRIKYGVV